jgi:hypothetical protein
MALLALVVACVLGVTAAQLADNLIVSGSDKPMAYGVGTYGLKGAGTQGISGEPNGGGLYSQKIPTVTISRRVPGVIVSDGAGHANVYQSAGSAFSALTNLLENNIGQQIESHLQQQEGPGIGGTSFAVAQSPDSVSMDAVASSPVSGPAELSFQVLQGRRLQQANILQNIGAQALGAVQKRCTCCPEHRLQ